MQESVVNPVGGLLILTYIVSDSHWMSHASSKHFPLTPRTPYSFWTATFDRLDNVCFLLLLNDSNQTPCAHKPLSLITPALALNSMNPQALSHIVLKQLVDPAAFHRISQRIGSNQSTILPPETARLSSKSLYIYIPFYFYGSFNTSLFDSSKYSDELITKERIATECVHWLFLVPVYPPTYQ